MILGKATLSEWASFRGFSSSSGWSGRGGQCNNPYALDRNPCGSSSGSAAAVSANLAAGGLGSETDGSVVCPSSACGVVGIKPTVGLVSRTEVVPISHTQDTIGVHGRTVADAAALLGPLTGGDPLDPATFASAGRSFDDYTQFVDPGGLAGKRIGVVRGARGASEEADALVAPTNSPAWPSDLVNGDCFLLGSSGWAAVAGYPLVTVPAGDASNSSPRCRSTTASGGPSSRAGRGARRTPVWWRSRPSSATGWRRGSVHAG